MCSVGYWLLDTGSLFTLVVFLCISGGAAVSQLLNLVMIISASLV